MRATFPCWNVWRSDEGGWWASRRHPYGRHGGQPDTR